MAFELKINESVPQGIRRIVRKEIDKSLDALTAHVDGSRIEAVHDARRRFKKIRAALKLVREELGPEVYPRENACFRDAGRPLTEVRDAQVLVETLDKLAAHYAAEVTRESLEEARRELLAHERAICKRVLDEENAQAVVAVILQASRPRVKDWVIEHDGWAALRNGLKSVYRRGRKAFAAAASEPSVEHLHEWRKRVKDLWHQLQIIEPMHQSLAQEAIQAHELADALGDDHDLAVLRDFLTEIPGMAAQPAMVATLLGLIARRRDELQQAADLLGRRIFASKPKEFVARLHDLWRVWRTDGEASEREKPSPL